MQPDILKLIVEVLHKKTRLFLPGFKREGEREKII
jgi:hypothetical protein